MKLLILSLSFLVFGILSISRSSDSVRANENFQPSYSDTTQLCIVSGEPIETGGVKYKYLNKEIIFCCEGCIKAFKKEPAKYLTVLRCPICDDDDGKRDISAVNDGVKYYFCSSSCRGKFENDANKYLENYSK
ncbi:MAG: hypothetical protein L0Y79_03455 [Chlorobi bacterium]|nr:hypothetical protein [Chlorobiota bacterium]MCI0716167.1 hypothetical protein [Chlorobiota bacterium]